MKKLYYFVLRISFLAFISFISACSPNIDNAEPATDIFFPKRLPPTGNTITGYMEAINYGKLELKGKWLGFKRTNGSFKTFIAWPSTYNLVTKNEEIYITHNNKVVAKIGDYLALGGGMVGIKKKT